uniref:G domain-containing protein n=2 Tax=Amphiprion percula TaxID=161767 RepID=A0A3P8SI25_AMPPE
MFQRLCWSGTLTAAMGGILWSRPADTFPEDWRKIPMSKDQYLDYVKNYQLHHDDIQQLRILLHGPNGAGKSSFINSVDTVLRGRMTGQALADGIGVHSFTIEYRTFKIQKEARGTFYPFAFADIMGLENVRGVSVEDIKQVMKGHVRDGYRFNPSAAISDGDNGYNNNPSLNDKVHVLVYVVSADALSLMNPETMRKMREVRLAARDLGIPQLAVLTKIDAACPVVREDVRNVYKSIYIKELMEKLSADLGIPPYCIFPVKNYHWEITPEDVSDRLILSALKQMIDFGDDFINNHM